MGKASSMSHRTVVVEVPHRVEVDIRLGITDEDIGIALNELHADIRDAKLLEQTLYARRAA